MSKARKMQIEYGDFQTPLELAMRVCGKLAELGVAPELIIEPTCGTGAFVEAAAQTFPSARKIIGVEINPAYLAALQTRKQHFAASDRVQLLQGDFFALDWQALTTSQETLLVIGNFPWVTNSQQGAIGGSNLPRKTNFRNRSGLEALTGTSNFDISEWMLIQTSNWLRHRRGHLAMLVKTSVARKFLHYLYTQNIPLRHAAIYPIETEKYFGVSVQACLLFCEFDGVSHNYDYEVFESLESGRSFRVGHRNGMTVRDVETFERLRRYYGTSSMKWRSGIKHDCAAVLELQKSSAGWMNGLGETVDVEPERIYPLLKGSDVANNRTTATNRYILLTQTAIGQPTRLLQTLAPKTWAYLEAHAACLDERKSRIYRNGPRFSMFGVGSYTFAPYKVAICGLYKKLEFRMVEPIDGKPVIFDDTVYFLSFETREEAARVLEILSSSTARAFYNALIFWDEKRPIKSSLLN